MTTLNSSSDALWLTLDQIIERTGWPIEIARIRVNRLRSRSVILDGATTTIYDVAEPSWFPLSQDERAREARHAFDLEEVAIRLRAGGTISGRKLGKLFGMDHMTLRGWLAQAPNGARAVGPTTPGAGIYDAKVAITYILERIQR